MIESNQMVKGGGSARSRRGWLNLDHPAGNCNLSIAPNQSNLQFLPRGESLLEGRFADMVVECTVESSGGETLQRLRGRVSAVNEVGMVAAFEERLTAGQKLKVRLIRRDREIAVPGRVVQV
ncbi:MAG: hypothetical protein ACHQ7N_17960, partial [Candidatus Methylomirabilales bacterium]